MTDAIAKKWNKTIWGILLQIFLFPFFILYFATYKIKLNEKLKIGISFIIPIILVLLFVPKLQYQQIGDVEDVSYGNVSRYVVRIVVPENIKKNVLEQTLKYVAQKTCEAKKANAVSVFAYHENDDYQNMYTVAKFDYAPSGDWKNAHQNLKKEYLIEYRK